MSYSDIYQKLTKEELREIRRRYENLPESKKKKKIYNKKYYLNRKKKLKSEIK